jgi:TIR domain
VKVFISWSGPVSHRLALALRDWMPHVLQSVQPFVSSEDIATGAKWLSKLEDEINKAEFGIICLTPDNVGSPWINFEAGALLGRNKPVAPLLFQLETSVESPLTKFYDSATADRDEVLKLMESINAASTDGQIKDELLRAAFERTWPDFEHVLHDLTSSSPEQAEKRTPDEMLEEIVDTVRSISRQLGGAAAFPFLPIERWWVQEPSRYDRYAQVVERLNEAISRLPDSEKEHMLGELARRWAVRSSDLGGTDTPESGPPDGSNG